MRGADRLETQLLEARGSSFPEMRRKQNQMIRREAERERGGRGLHTHLNFLWRVGTRSCVQNEQIGMRARNWVGQKDVE